VHSFRPCCLPLSGGERLEYKRGMAELGRKGLPRAIRAEELQIMLGTSSAFCSWDASNSTISELMDSWPFLFSHPLLGASHVLGASREREIKESTQ
jgi:hypothetical protein